MNHGEPTRPTERLRVPHLRIVAGLLVSAALGVAVGCQSTGNSSSAAPPPVDIPQTHRLPPLPTDGGAVPARMPRGPLGEADGALPAGTTVFDDDVPGVANLDPALLAALRRAATDAAHDGVTFSVDSGWRSPAYQQELLDQAVSKYGSEKSAARWVATPTTSLHVKGDAVDLGSRGAKWLSAHGATYGLCQIYRNESWHYELRPAAVDAGCPAMYPDAAHDPRLQP